MTPSILILLFVLHNSNPTFLHNPYYLCTWPITQSTRYTQKKGVYLTWIKGTLSDYARCLNTPNYCNFGLFGPLSMIFLAGNQLYELKCHRIGWWGGWGRQKKSIAIFAYKQRILSIEMKTKLVQHVATINISIS